MYDNKSTSSQGDGIIGAKKKSPMEEMLTPMAQQPGTSMPQGVMPAYMNQQGPSPLTVAQNGNPDMINSIKNAFKTPPAEQGSPRVPQGTIQERAMQHAHGGDDNMPPYLNQDKLKAFNVGYQK